MAAKKSPKICDCASKMNKELEKKNGQLDMAVFIMKGIALPQIATLKVNTKLREKPPLVVPTYCPFCGQKYELDG